MSLPALERYAKWRTLLTGWQLGTRAKGDPETDAVRDHREQSLIMRAEITALVQLLVHLGVITIPAFELSLEEAADLHSAAMEQRFPGVRATDEGLHVVISEALPWLKDWKP